MSPLPTPGKRKTNLADGLYSRLKHKTLQFFNRESQEQIDTAADKGKRLHERSSLRGIAPLDDGCVRHSPVRQDRLAGEDRAAALTVDLDCVRVNSRCGARACSFR